MRASDLKSVIASHVARNWKLCQLTENKGADLSAKRCIDLYFWAENEFAAHRLANTLRECGWSQIKLNPLDHDTVWNVEVQIEASVVEIIDLVFTEKLSRLAMDNQSKFDGWGASI